MVAAPNSRPQPDRSWGTFLPLYALRRDSGDLGVGSFRDLGDLGDWTNALGGSFVGTLPLLAPFVDSSGIYAGPYLPASKLAWNEAYIDLDSLPELDSEDRWAAMAREATQSAKRGPVGAGTGTGTGGKHADIAAVLRLKRPILELLAKSLYESSSARRKEFEEFLHTRTHVLEYARFRAAGESTGARWHDWPGGRSRELPNSSLDEDAVRYHLYSQWVCDQQLAESSRSGVYLDIPVGVHPSGFDTWLRPGSFVTGVSGGAPPDAFFAEGQSWGFPPLHPDGIRSDGYRYFIDCLRHVMAHGAMVRVDHVMGMHRLYWVPDGFEPGRGAYVSYRADEMHAVLVLEASRSGTAVVGEDLGTVPSAVRADMARDGMLSSFVLQFESTQADPFPVPKPRSLATLGTHDLPTFQAYWNGQDIEEQESQGRLDARNAATMNEAREMWRTSTLEHLGAGRPESSASGGTSGESGLPAPEQGAGKDTTMLALRGFLEHLGRSPASVVLVDLEDLWLEPDQQNRPGTPAQAGNFMRRASRTMEEFETDPSVLVILDALDNARFGDVDDPSRINRDEEEPMKRTSDLGKTSAASLLGEQDLYLFNEGTHRGLAAKMGAHLVPSYEGSGVSFAVWAPNAAQVSVIGDFNGWRGDQDRLSPEGPRGSGRRRLTASNDGQVYKYEIRTRQGERLEKADPFAHSLRGSSAYGFGHMVAGLPMGRRRMDAPTRRGELDARPVSMYEVASRFVVARSGRP